LIELGYDQPLKGQGPEAAYGYYYYSNPEFHGTNIALRLAIAPVYADGELGFRGLISPTTDFGIGFDGGLYGDNFYEIRQGHYFKEESFDGHNGGLTLGLYQLLDPGMLIPLNAVVRAGFKYDAYVASTDTSDNFHVPANRVTGFVRSGLRFAGKEPILFPDLGLEASLWVERQWRSNDDPFGFALDRTSKADTTLYWAYMGLNYSWTNIAHKVSLAVTLAGSSDADRFSAWRPGGELPLAGEFPLVMPGYFYQELTAKSLLHMYGAYFIPIEPSHRLQLMVEAAGAKLDYLPGFEQPSSWQAGAGAGLSYTPSNKVFRVVLRYGYGFNAVRTSGQGSQSIGLLFQYDFEAWKKSKED
jgi:hypothetical protein